MPLQDGKVTDDTRIKATLDTLTRLAGAGARTVVASHLGRPEGKHDLRFSMRPVAQRLEKLLDQPVGFVDACVGRAVEEATSALPEGGILVLENLRFEPGETSNDPAFRRELAKHFDAYVNDAFGTSHRTHASIAGVPEILPRSFAGALLEAELDHLEAVKNPVRPLLCLLGGAKVSDKLAVLESLAPHADELAVGGAMAYTFLAALGQPTGKSLVEKERIVDAERVIKASEAAGRSLLLPTDHRVVREIEASADVEVVETIPDQSIAVDIGPRTAERYADASARAATLFWNGPMGIFEIPAFSLGTQTVARGVADSKAHSIVGGGDSLAAINQLGLADHIGHLSTGGGASLEYIQGRTLPGVSALDH